MQKPKRSEISSSVIKRLPRYYRFIGELIKQGIVRSSSGELAEKMSLTASQIRQDLNCFGGFGQQGYGYNLVELRTEIGKILGIDRGYKAVLFGAGNLGKAIASHMNFGEYGWELIGIFDSDLRKENEKVADLSVMHISRMESFITENKPEIAILCIPKVAAQEYADKLVSLGIKAFWNFSHYDLAVSHKNIVVQNVHLGDSIMTLSYGLTTFEDEE
ncbi:MAG: redox-sensing transcriptional repressor Rex [Oscillospiraceae bacterium]|nr:redox-sensing transcriptional repressor Rex [Oscillospiraceae bacterium]